MAKNLPALRRPKKPVTLNARRSDRQYLPHAQELLETPPSARSAYIIWTLCLLMTAGLWWAFSARLDIYAVAIGHVEHTGRSKIVQPVEVGKVHAVLVENGTRVRAGQGVVELDSAEAAAELAAVSHDLESARAEIARRQVAIRAVGAGTPCCPKIAFPPGIDDATKEREEGILVADLGQVASEIESLRAQINTKAATRQRLVASIQSEQRLLGLTKERLGVKVGLARISAGTRTAVLDAQEQVEQGTVKLAYDRGQVQEADAGAESLRRSIDVSIKKFVADQAQRLQEAQRQADGYQQDVIKARAKLEHVRLTAPIDGTVQQLAVTTVGQVVAAGQPLMVVVPSEGSIEIQAFMPGQDIGFVSVGQPVDIKVDAFPFTRYGTLPGTITRISRDAVDVKKDVPLDASDVARDPNAASVSATPKTQRLVFPFTIKVNRRTLERDGKQVSLLPGMTVTAEVRTGTRSVVEYLFAPLVEAAKGR